MFQRYTEHAREAIFLARVEAGKTGSSFIESEHLLLGVMRSCESDIAALFNFESLQNLLRAHLSALPKHEPSATDADLPLSNQIKRILAYAAEESVWLDSRGLDAHHLLLGILREPDSLAARFLSSKAVDLSKARQLLAAIPQTATTNDTQTNGFRLGLWVQSDKKRYWIGAVTQIAIVTAFAVGLVKSTIGAPHLLIITSAWFLAVLAWVVKGTGSFFCSYGKLNRGVAFAVTYVLFSLYQLFIFGWIVPLAIGIYRVSTH
jgi:Clp amino terminal domain, pathogenicity island component